MPVITDFSRRNVIRYAAAVPLLSQIAARSVFANVASRLEKLVAKMCIPAWAQRRSSIVGRLGHI